MNTATYRRSVAQTMHETKDLLPAVIEAARGLGWRVIHSRNTYSEGRWHTPLAGDPGAPDLILVRAGRVLLVELKSQRGKLSANQQAWRDAIMGGPVEYYLWRPSDWLDGTITAILGDA